MRKIVIVGAGETAELAYDYFSNDTNYEVAAFSVESPFIVKESLFGKPIVPVESLEDAFSPANYLAFVAISYTKLNRVRRKLFELVEAKGFEFASYVSSSAYIGRSVSIGRNAMIMENNVLQYHSSVGDDIILWSGNHIGHRSVIGGHTFLSSHVVVSGFCEIGENCFLGVNATIGDNVKIADDCVIGGGAVILSNTSPGQIFRGQASKAERLDSYSVFGLKRGE
jgi:sugar O-acyltransferase (sialic acid O-acetyltransferase NeuD family)